MLNFLHTMPSLIKTPSRPHRLPCRSPPAARKLPPTPWPVSGRKWTRLHLPLFCTVIESRGRVLDRVDIASWKCPFQYFNLNLVSLKIRGWGWGWDGHKLSRMSKSTNNTEVSNRGAITKKKRKKWENFLMKGGGYFFSLKMSQFQFVNVENPGWYLFF